MNRGRHSPGPGVYKHSQMRGFTLNIHPYWNINDCLFSIDERHDSVFFNNFLLKIFYSKDNCFV